MNARELDPRVCRVIKADRPGPQRDQLSFIEVPVLAQAAHFVSRELAGTAQTFPNYLTCFSAARQALDRCLIAEQS